jgi:hypothetical protein
MNRIKVLTLSLIALGLITGCTKKSGETKKQETQSNVQRGAGAALPTVAGINWSVPEGWTPQPQKPMRVATYTVPAPKEGTEAGECGVFYFGGTEGGSVNDNLNRWISQFENGGKHEFSSKEINGLKTTLVQISGAYLAPSGPMMESQGKKENFRLLGAIVEAPRGLVFFKLTGPEPTITGAESAFNSLVNSIVKAPPPL